MSLLPVYKYFREIVASYPTAFIKGCKHYGWRGGYLATCGYVFRSIPTPVEVPGFGTLRQKYEPYSFLDNFCLGELRSEEMEKAYVASEAPLVVDLGINLGMSVRWWFHLNKNAEVIGADMMQEALDYTSERLKECHPGAKWKPVCCAIAASDGEPVTVEFADPLDPTAQIGGGDQQKQRREVPTRSMDSVLAGDTRDILVLKCDIEGHGGYALEGAREILKRTHFVVTETHGADEIVRMSRVLFESGFVPYELASRSIWWRRDQKSA